MPHTCAGVDAAAFSGGALPDSPLSEGAPRAEAGVRRRRLPELGFTSQRATTSSAKPCMRGATRFGIIGDNGCWAPRLLETDGGRMMVSKPLAEAGPDHID